MVGFEGTGVNQEQNYIVNCIYKKTMYIPKDIVYSLSYDISTISIVRMYWALMHFGVEYACRTNQTRTSVPYFVQNHLVIMVVLCR